MLSQAIGDLLPLAVGVALSPIPIVAVILMLGTPKARSNGPAFAVGWVLGLVAVSVIVLVVAGGSDSSSTKSDTSDTIKLLLGIAFLFMAMRQWRKRPKKGEEPTMPKWMNMIDKFPPHRAFSVGALLSGVNPKNLALTLAAAASIAQTPGLSTADQAIAVAVFVVIGSITVVGPVLFFMFASERATKPLASIKEFMADHNAVIMMVLLLVLGAKLIGSGWAGLDH